jgi:superfamily I DNA and RNA helicase
MMPSSYFYSSVEKNDENTKLIDSFENYAQEHSLQIYIIDKPLGESKYRYNQSNVLVLLIPKSKITFINLGIRNEEFSDFVDDFVEDIGIISDKYGYREVLGRPKRWREEATITYSYNLATFNISDMITSIEVIEKTIQKKCELLISLLTGSINDVSRVKSDVPTNLLEKIQQKIVLFDGDQTRFIFSIPEKKIIRIQGLSGTGKTELLLHKMKDVYTRDDSSRILFTCHNKILADSLKTRIPAFFNFLKVDQQIKWDERLFCFHAWGSYNYVYSGTYRYICSVYEIEFFPYSSGKGFNSYCEQALIQIQQIKAKKGANFEYAFDYSFIDESQDFQDGFINLVSEVTKKNVYVAGDIFQSIFSIEQKNDFFPDYLLSKCYRTDPKTLMFAHALGMGLFENPHLRWLEDDQWKATGYSFQKKEGIYTFRREPLRRFEDLETSNYQSMRLVIGNSNQPDTVTNSIISMIEEIKFQNQTVSAEDIAVIFVDDKSSTYNYADILAFQVPSRLGWKVNKAYETKKKESDCLFITNRNNVKGLEFPFIICITNGIIDDFQYRNALYTMITRSFIQTTLFITSSTNYPLEQSIRDGLNTIMKQGIITVKEPSDEEKREILTRIKQNSHPVSLHDKFIEICDKLSIPKNNRKMLLNAYMNTFSDNTDTFDETSLTEWISLSDKMIGNK